MPFLYNVSDFMIILINNSQINNAQIYGNNCNSVLQNCVIIMNWYAK